MILIGIGYKKQSGKDTVADYLVKNYSFARIGFADRLKEIAGMCGWDGKKDERGRKLLQLLGTEVIRNYNPNFWIDYLCCGVVRHSDSHIVIPDVRFKNEADAVKKWGGVLIKVNRGQATQDKHASEVDLDGYDFDYTINNDDSFKTLYHAVDTIIADLGGL